MSPERIIVLWFTGWPAEQDFAPTFAQLIKLVPQIEILRPGLVAMRARGPARYYGGETGAASALLDFARGEGFTAARVGIADGRFAAEQAATAGAPPPDGLRIVTPGASAKFLSPLPVHLGTDEALATLLTGLGMYTLGAFAALPEESVRARFGPVGIRAHRHARGEDAERGEPIRPQQAARDLETGLDFEPPLSGTDQLAFACSALVEGLAAALAAERLVCTTLRITLTDDVGVRHEHDWSHPRFFEPADMIARIRWQAGSLNRPSESTGAGVTAIRISPIATDRTAAHEPGLWTSGPDARVHHHLSRAQSVLGPSGVGTILLDGGRLLRDRQQFTPWGTAPRRTAPPGPWPGALPEPHPTLVFPVPLRAKLLSHDRSPVGIDGDEFLTFTPHQLLVEGYDALAPVRAWSRPWPIRERWWEGRAERFRLQLELEDGDAWLLLAQFPTGWFAEGRYD